MKLGLKIGILGGGQLARMLILQGQRMGFSMYVMCPNEDEPAAQVTQFHYKGNPNNFEELIHFFKLVDVVTLESEFYSGFLLERVFQKLKIPIYPSPSNISSLQDRLPQKKLLARFKIPTSPFSEITNETDLHKFAAKNSKFVLKKRCGGYDGNGTFVVDSENKKEWNSALTRIKDYPLEYLVEEFVPFKRELAIMIVRNPDQEIIHFPLVETKQNQNRCDWVFGPIYHSKTKQLLKKLFHLLNSIDYIGCIGFELFDTGHDLLINEIAPRVHNSGHYSMDGLTDCQFSLHLKAILGLPLTKPLLIRKHFAMINLIGSKNTFPEFPSHFSGRLHWYGKLENRPGRKMGHVNYIGESKFILKKALSERLRFEEL